MQLMLLTLPTPAPTLGRPRAIGMEWLNLALPAQTAFSLEQQRRELRGCSDPDVLRAMAEALLQEVHHLSNINKQLVAQVLNLEVDLVNAGGLPAPSEKHMAWAREILDE